MSRTRSIFDDWPADSAQTRPEQTKAEITTGLTFGSARLAPKPRAQSATNPQAQSAATPREGLQANAEQLHAQANKRPRMSEHGGWVSGFGCSSGATNDAGPGNTSDTHSEALKKALEATYQEAATKQSEAIAGLKQQISETSNEAMTKQSTAIFELRKELEAMYQKTMGAQTQLNLELKNQLVDMTKSRDEYQRQAESLKAEPLQLRAAFDSKKEEARQLSHETIKLRAIVDKLKVQAERSTEEMAAKDLELQRRRNSGNTFNESTNKIVEEIKKETNRIIEEVNKEDVGAAEKEILQARLSLEEVKTESEKKQRELQDEIARLRGKEIDSRIAIRRLLGVIRDAAPGSLCEVMNDHLLDALI